MSLVSKHRQCCASGVIYSRFGSCTISRSFRIRIHPKTQCCWSGIFIQDPGYNERSKRGGGMLSYLFLWPQVFHNWKLFIFEQVQKKYEPVDKELKYFLLLSSQKYGLQIRDPEKTYSASRIKGSKRHPIPGPDSQHCLNWPTNHFKSFKCI
jgi:hypothetical protein